MNTTILNNIISLIKQGYNNLSVIAFNIRFLGNRIKKCTVMKYLNYLMERNLVRCHNGGFFLAVS